MKTSEIISKAPFILCLLFVLTLTSSCTKDISGECTFHVLNKVDKKIRVFFDGDKIGKVAANSAEQWNVPSGRFLIKVTCWGLDPYEEYLTFYENARNELIIEEDEFKSTNKIVVRQQMLIRVND